MHQTLVITRARPKNATSRNKSERQQLQPFLHRTIWISGNPRLISNLSHHHLQPPSAISVRNACVISFACDHILRLGPGCHSAGLNFTCVGVCFWNFRQSPASCQLVAWKVYYTVLPALVQKWLMMSWSWWGRWSLRKVWRKIKTCRDSYAASLSTQSSREVGVDLHQRNKLLCRSQSALHRPPQSCQIERLILPKIDIQASEKVRFDTQGLEAFERLRHCFVFSTWLTEDLRGTRSSRRCYFFKLNYLK